jgi:pimeloyl-ACP methyl ester carboxylesterase
MECQVRDIVVHYETSGAGRPVVILHGKPADHRFLKPVLEPIFATRSGWKRIYPDLPGVGETKLSDWINSNDDLLDVAVEFINTMIPGERFTLIGNSWGSYIARGIVTRMRAQVEGLFLWAPVKYPRAERRPVPPRTVLVSDPALEPELRNDLERYLFDNLAAQSRRALNYIRTYLVPSLETGSQDFDQRIGATGFSFPLETAPFDKPALIICGRQDSMVGYRDALDIVEAYPRATFVIVDKAGHLIGLAEQEALFERLVSEWLERVEEEIGAEAQVARPSR